MGSTNCDARASAPAATRMPSTRVRGERAVRTSVVMLLPPVDGEGDPFAATEAERREAAVEIAVLQCVQQRREHTGATPADRMSERGGAAGHVDAVPIPVESRTVGERLRREGFVRLDQVIVADRLSLSLHEIV